MEFHNIFLMFWQIGGFLKIIQIKFYEFIQNHYLIKY